MYASTRRVDSLANPDVVVVATDLTDLRCLMPVCVGQAMRRGAEVHVVHSVSGFDSAERANSRADANASLASFCRELQSRGIAATYSLSERSPVVAVLKDVLMKRACRLIIGSHRHGNTGQTLLGTVANALIREADIPVLVAPCRDGCLSERVSRIVHPVSLSHSSIAGTEFAIALAEAMGAELTLLYVVNASLLHGAYVQQIFADAQHHLRALIPPDIGARVHTVVKAGDVVSEILAVSSAVDADEIVMDIERDYPWWSMSNNAAYQVIAQGTAPVLITRSRMFEERSPVPHASALVEE